MPSQTETQADMIARLLTENEKFRDTIARLQEAADGLLNVGGAAGWELRPQQAFEAHAALRAALEASRRK